MYKHFTYVLTNLITSKSINGYSFYVYHDIMYGRLFIYKKEYKLMKEFCLRVTNQRLNFLFLK